MSAPLPLTPGLLDRLGQATADLAFARSQVSAFYDGWLRARLGADGPAGFVHAVVSGAEASPALHPGRDSDALCLALSALGGPSQILECYAAAVAAGLFDGTVDEAGRAAHREGLTARMRAALGTVDSRAILQSSTREALTTTDDIWVDPGNLLPAILLARRRMCKILTYDDQEKPITGSGFLIGPSSVLTNFHVVKHLPPTLADPDRLRVQFDFSKTTGLDSDESAIFRVRPDWRAAKSDLGSDGPNEDYWWDDLAKRDAWLASVKGDHDYAVLTLDGAPGLQRGWYRLDEASTKKPSKVWVLHHPGTEYHTISTGAVRLARVGSHRIFHLAPTIPGSSGGLVLNETGEPVGLHYMGLVAKADPMPGTQNQINKALNVAVSLATIATDLTQKALLTKIGEASGIRPYRGCLDGKRPVFGRESYLDLLERLWRGEPQMLIVHVAAADPPLSRPGKSFSQEILQSVFAAPEHHHISFKAGDIKVDAYKMAVETVKTFAKSEVARLPEKPDTTTPAYVRRLVSAVGQIVSERLSNKLVWITLDDLDKHDLSDASGREFLATLYNQITRMPNLRVVLIGLPEGIAIGGMEEKNVLRSYISPADVGDLDKKLEAWLKERGAQKAVFTEQSYGFLTKVLMSVAKTPYPMAALSGFIAKHVAEAADEYLGAAKPPENGGGT
jgi:V8-like Glu-specific endopeptidase